MTIGNWISLAAIIFVYGSSILGFYIFVKLKLKELEMGLENLKQEHENFKTLTYNNNLKMNRKIDLFLDDNKKDHKDISLKMESLIQSLNDFRVYVERTKKTLL